MDAQLNSLGYKGVQLCGCRFAIAVLPASVYTPPISAMISQSF